jgi:exonuclease III
MIYSTPYLSELTCSIKNENSSVEIVCFKLQKKKEKNSVKIEIRKQTNSNGKRIKVNFHCNRVSNLYLVTNFPSLKHKSKQIMFDIFCTKYQIKVHKVNDPSNNFNPTSIIKN